MSRWLRFLALVLALALLAWGYLFVRRVEREDQTRIYQLYRQVEPLQKEKDALEAQRDALEAAYVSAARDVSTVQFLFREADEMLFSEVWPLLRQRGFVGMIGLSSTEFPGLEGKISLDQYKRLLADGWIGCLMYEPDTPLDEWHHSMMAKLEASGLELPHVLYFPEGSFSADMYDLLQIFDTQVVLIETRGVALVSANSTDALPWMISAGSWNYAGLLSDLEELSLTDGGNLCLLVSFRNLWDPYEPDAFLEMLEKIAPMTTAEVSSDPDVERATGRLRVCTCTQAMSLHQSRQSEAERLEEDHLRQINALDEQIAALDREISAMYDAWNEQATRDQSPLEKIKSLFD